MAGSMGSRGHLPLVAGNAFSQQASRKPANNPLPSQYFGSIDDDYHDMKPLPTPGRLERSGSGFHAHAHAHAHGHAHGHAPKRSETNFAPRPLEPKRPQLVRSSVSGLGYESESLVPAPLVVNQNRAAVHQKNRSVTEPLPTSTSKQFLQQSKQLVTDLKNKLTLGGSGGGTSKDDPRKKLLPPNTPAKASAVLGVKIDTGKGKTKAAESNGSALQSPNFPTGPYYGDEVQQYGAHSMDMNRSVEAFDDPTSRFFEENADVQGQDDEETPLLHELALGVYGPPQPEACIVGHGQISPTANGGYALGAKVNISHQPRHVASMAGVIDHVREEQREEQQNAEQYLPQTRYQPQHVRSMTRVIEHELEKEHEEQQKAQQLLPQTRYQPAGEIPVCYSPSIYSMYNESPPHSPAGVVLDYHTTSSSNPYYANNVQANAPAHVQQHLPQNANETEDKMHGLKSVSNGSQPRQNGESQADPSGGPHCAHTQKATAPVQHQQNESQYLNVSGGSNDGVKSSRIVPQQLQNGTSHNNPFNGPLAGVGLTNTVPFPPGYQDMDIHPLFRNPHKEDPRVEHHAGPTAPEFVHPNLKGFNHPSQTQLHMHNEQDKSDAENGVDVSEKHSDLEQGLRRTVRQVDHIRGWIEKKDRDDEDLKKKINEMLSLTEQNSRLLVQIAEETGRQLQRLGNENIRLIQQVGQVFRAIEKLSSNKAQTPRLPSAMKGGRAAASASASEGEAANESNRNQVRFAEGFHARQPSYHHRYPVTPVGQPPDILGVVQSPTRALEYSSGPAWYQHQMACNEAAARE